MELGLSLSLAGQRQIPMSARVKAALKRYDARLYIPGPGGVTVQSFQPGNYVVSTGVTPGSVDGLVGLVLDAAGSVGDDILGGAGTFDSASGWTLGSGWSISGGAAVASTATASLSRSAPVLANRSYRVTYDIVSYTSGTVRANVGGSTNGVVNSSLGTKSEVINSASTDGKVYLVVSNFVGQIDNFTVREVTGIHASQVTQGYKPWLRRGIVNLLTYSNDLTNAAWNKTALVVSGAQVAATAVSSEHYLDDSAATSFVSGSTYTKAVLAKANGLRYVRLAFPSAAFPLTGRAAWFDLQSGTVGTVQGGVTASITAIGNSFLCAISATANATASSKGFVSLAVNDGGSLTFVGDGSSGLVISSAGLFQGSLTAQQILDAGGIPLTTSAPASSANGKFWWQCDAIDDKLAMTFPAGWESATIIDSRSTGQVTQTAQNIVGTYNIQTSTYGRIFCRLAPSASDLALLQKFANILAGV